MTSNIKVVDVNEEAKQDAPEVKTEEVTKEVEETQNEVVNEPVIEPVIENKEEATPKPKTLQDKVRCPKCYREMTIKAFKYRHEKACQGKLSEKPVKPHTKPKAKPKPKLEPIQEQAKGFLGSDASSEASRDYRDSVRAEPEEIQTPTQSSINPTQSEKQTPQPIHQINPLMSRMPREATAAASRMPREATAAASHYQLLQQQYMQQKTRKV